MVRPRGAPSAAARGLETSDRTPYYKLLFDLKFTRSGVKKWVTR